MDPIRHYFSYIGQTMQAHWSAVAVSDYEGEISYTYGQLAQQIEKIKIFFERIGLKPGDKVAICARNCSNWAVAYLAIAAYRAVAVTISPDFPDENIEKLIIHSDSKVLFSGPYVRPRINEQHLKDIKVHIALENFAIVKGPKAVRWSSIEEDFAARYPKGMKAKQLQLPQDNLDDLALINYAVDDIIQPRGVMLTHRNLSSNVAYGRESIPGGITKSVLAVLPLSQMLGLMFEFLYQVAGGSHVWFITKSLSAEQLIQAYQKVQPYMLVTVPGVIEKIVHRTIEKDYTSTLWQKICWNTPLLRLHYRNKAYATFMQTLGNKIEILVVGGGKITPSTERILHQIHFPYTCGYGLAECAPLLCYEFPKQYIFGSCGKVVDRMEIKIHSAHPHRVAGELMVRGDNVMRGYYRNMQATNAVITDDGWMYTGMTAIVDRKGNVFLKEPKPCSMEESGSLDNLDIQENTFSSSSTED